MRVAELPDDDRPREKMIAKGPASLSDAELLAILVRIGPRDEPVLDLARRWLDESGGLTGLAALDIAELLKRRGIGPSKATIVAAALELGRRLARAQAEARDLLDRPELAAELLARRHAGERVEIFGCLTLDSRHRLVRERVLHRGARTHADVEPAELFRVAIADNAHGVIVWHTHPSGDPSPSEDDVALTRQLVAAGKALGIRVLDHLVVAGSGFVSLRQRGMMPAA